MDAHTRGLPPMPLFREWWAEFITTRVGVRPSTRLRDESIFRCHLDPFFGDMPIDQIGYRDAQRFVAELATTNLSARTVHKAAGLLAQSLDIAVRARLLDHNPTRALSLPQVPHREPRFLNPSEVARLADTIAAPYRTFVLVGAYAGLRNGELTALRARRIDAAASTIGVAETRTLAPDGSPTFGPPKSRAGRRTVPVPAFVMTELATDLSARAVGPDELVWTSPAGQPLGDANFRRRIWKPATTKAGLDGLRIHDLRHTCVAMWSRSLASPRAAAKWAGHSNPSLILSVYGGVLRRRERGGHATPGRIRRRCPTRLSLLPDRAGRRCEDRRCHTWPSVSSHEQETQAPIGSTSPEPTAPQVRDQCGSGAKPAAAGARRRFMGIEGAR